MSKPILCLDFDGVLHSYTSGWKGAGVAGDPPVEGALNFLYEATKRFRVAIYSSRSKSLAGRACMRRYIREHLDMSLTFSPGHERWDFLHEAIEWPWFKPSAFVTIDDRAITFDGTWPALESLAAFKPWNKRAAQTARSPQAEWWLLRGKVCLSKHATEAEAMEAMAAYQACIAKAEGRK